MLEKNGKCVTPDSLNQIALLQVRRHDKLRLLARGPDADAALAAFQALAADNFGESPEAQPTAEPAIPARVEGAALLYRLALDPTGAPRRRRALPDEQQRLRQAIDQTLADLNALTELAEDKFNADILGDPRRAPPPPLLDDEDLFDAANDRLLTEQCSAEWAWHQVLMELSQQYRQLDDAYLQARYIDVDDILQRTLRHLQGIKETLPFASEPTIYRRQYLSLDRTPTGCQQGHRSVPARRQRTGPRRDYRPRSGDRLAMPAGRSAE